MLGQEGLMSRKLIVILDRNMLLATEIDFAIGDALGDCDVHNAHSIDEALQIALRNGTARIEGRMSSVAIIDHATVQNSDQSGMNGLMARFDAIVLAGWPDGDTPTDGHAIARLAKPFAIEDLVSILREAFDADSCTA